MRKPVVTLVGYDGEQVVDRRIQPGSFVPRRTMVAGTYALDAVDFVDVAAHDPVGVRSHERALCAMYSH